MADWLYPFLTAPVVTTASAIADVAEEAINALKGTFILVVLGTERGHDELCHGRDVQLSAQHPHGGEANPDHLP